MDGLFSLSVPGVSSTGLPDVLVKSTIKHATAKAVQSGLSSFLGEVLIGLKAASGAILKGTVHAMATVTSRLIYLKAKGDQIARQVSLNNDIETAKTGKPLLDRMLEHTFSFENITVPEGVLFDAFDMKARYLSKSVGPELNAANDRLLKSAEKSIAEKEAVHWVDEAVRIKWPTNDGFEGQSTPPFLKKGSTFDRFG